MATIVKVRALWTGFAGAPGYTNWYGLSDGDAAAAANALGPRMRTFFNAIKGSMPDDVHIKVEQTYQVVDTNTGNITGEALLSADPAVVDGADPGAWAAPVGACVNWVTGQFNEQGHRITGRTYLVPLSSGAFQNDGTLTSTTQSSIQAAAAAAIGGTGNLVVYSRPPGGPGSLGTAWTVASATVPDRAIILRTRRA